MNEIRRQNDQIEINYKLKPESFQKKTYDVGLYFSKNKGRSWKEISKRSCSGDIGKNIRSNYLKKTIYWNPKNYRKAHNKTIYLGLKLKPTQGKINLTSNTRSSMYMLTKNLL